MSQSTARRMLSLYLPSRMVLPCMSMAMPLRPVMVNGYWPPKASQWPSLLWLLASHSRPFSTQGRNSAGISSARAALPPSPARATAPTPTAPASRASRRVRPAPVRKGVRMGFGSLMPYGGGGRDAPPLF